MRSYYRLGIAVLILSSYSILIVRTAEEQPDLTPDEKTLRDQKIGTDGPALLEFIRQRTLSDAQRTKLAETVRRLGHNDFDEREKASEDLFRAGQAAVPFLRKALGDPDAEIDRRARDCLQRIDSGRERHLVFAALRILAARRPAEADRVLLDYLPYAPDEWIGDTVLAALETVAVRDTQPSAALKNALDDKDPLRRAAAAQVIALHCPAERPAVAKLLTDAEPRVRFRAASSLARTGDRRAVPPLIALLTDGSPDIAWQVENLLLALAGDKAPLVVLESANEPRARSVAPPGRIGGRRTRPRWT